MIFSKKQLIVSLFILFWGSDVIAKSARPIPRFASIRSNEVRMRAGPGKDFPVLWVIKYKSMPVKIVAEYETWRKIVLQDDSSGWVHQSLLSGKRTLLVTAKETRLQNTHKPQSHSVAKLTPKLTLEFHKQKCSGNRCFVKVSGHEGWVDKKAVWGLLAHE